MKTGLRITGLIAWPLTALIIFLGGFLPLIFGLEMGVYDILLFLLEGLDAYTPDLQRWRLAFAYHRSCGSERRSGNCAFRCHIFSILQAVSHTEYDNDYSKLFHFII